MVQLSQPYTTAGKNIAFTMWIFVIKMMSLLFNTLSRFVIAFLPKKHSSSHSMAAVTIHSDFRALEEEICPCLPFSPFYVPWSDGARCHDLRFFNVEFQVIFSLSSFTLIKRFFSSSWPSTIRVVPSAYLRLLIFLPGVLIPVCNSSSLAFLMVCSEYKLNKQSDNKQPCLTLFSILNQ